MKTGSDRPQRRARRCPNDTAVVSAVVPKTTPQAIGSSRASDVAVASHSITGTGTTTTINSKNITAKGRKSRKRGRTVSAAAAAVASTSSIPTTTNTSTNTSTSKAVTTQTHASTESTDTATTVTDVNTILFNAFTNPYIKSIIQQQYDEGVLLQPAINSIRQSSSLFLYQFMTTLSDELRVAQSQTAEPSDSTITTEQNVLSTIRNIISQHPEYQFLIGTLDDLKGDDHHHKKKKASTSILLPASMQINTTRATKAKKGIRPTTKKSINEVLRLSNSDRATPNALCKEEGGEDSLDVTTTNNAAMDDHPSTGSKVPPSRGVIWDDNDYD